MDLARAAAIAGMMTVHILPAEAPGVAGVLYDVAHGRASGLFAVLAGLSLGLSTRRFGASARERAGARSSVVVRGALIALLGLALVSADSRIAIILPYYGVAFVVVLPFLWWPLRRLWILAGSWLALAPMAGWWLRSVYGLPPETTQPTLASLVDPLVLLRTLSLTGYYPVIGWAGYLLLGLAVSRMDLRSRSSAVRLLGSGAVLAGGSWIASGLLLGPLGGSAALTRRYGPFALDLQDYYGTVPSDSAWWLGVVAPHSGTPLDLLHTAGTALGVIGLVCLLPAAVTRVLVPVAALGSMPLTIYTAHVLALAAYPAETLSLLAVHVMVGVLVATAWRAGVGRGPLERIVGEAARLVGAGVKRVLPG
ncbi:MAG: heparan-alpha-glucosaminide N-acetyltransferase domain-containing protein [Janthinobacterium lividum]